MFGKNSFECSWDSWIESVNLLLCYFGYDSCIYLNMLKEYTKKEGKKRKNYKKNRYGSVAKDNDPGTAMSVCIRPC